MTGCSDSTVSGAAVTVVPGRSMSVTVTRTPLTVTSTGNGTGSGLGSSGIAGEV